MLRRCPATILAAVLAAVCLTPSAAPAAAAGVPADLPLTTGWQTLADPGVTGVKRGLWRPDNRADWQPGTVPSVLSDVTSEKLYAGTVGWYRVAFDAPERTPAFTLTAHFEQVRRTADVWLNGVKIGHHEDPYVPFDVGLERALRPGQRNVLVVRADSRKDRDPREGWWNWGGITRPVTLIPQGALLLRDPGVLSDVRCPSGGATSDCTRRVIFDAVLENRSSRTIAGGHVNVQVAGARMTVPARTLAPGERTHLRRTLTVPDAGLWSPEAPTLHAVKVTTLAGKRVTQVDRWRTGLRQVAVRDGMLTLNGRQLNLHGASIQEDVPGKGPALDDKDIAKIVADLKSVGANVTRAHYLLNPKLLDALDAAGIMVWNQAPIYHRDVLLKTRAQRDEALATLRGTVLNARNHPSVITHSVANELSAVPDTVPGTRAYLDAARTVAGEADPTIPISVDLLSYPGYGHQKTFDQYDLLGINSYFGWYRGKKDHSTADLADLGPFLDRMRRLYPTQALVVTEFGAESTFSGPADEKETYAFQEQYLKGVMDIVAQRPFVGGSIYWTLREFAVKPDWDGGANRDVARNAIHHKGLITYAGQKKPAFQTAERAFSDLSLYRSVSPAAAAGVPGAGRGPGGLGAILAVLICALVVLLLAVDGWAILGILRGDHRDPRRAGSPRRPAHGGPGDGGGPQAAGARAS